MIFEPMVAFEGAPVTPHARFFSSSSGSTPSSQTFVPVAMSDVSDMIHSGLMTPAPVLVTLKEPLQDQGAVVLLVPRGVDQGDRALLRLLFQQPDSVLP